MNKTAVKNFSIWARIELKKAVALKAYEYVITPEAAKAGTIKPSTQVQTLGGGLLNDTQRHQRDALLREIKNKGYNQVIEEVAYTWFNRFIAIKYMEVHGYLPISGRVLPGPEGQPPILTADALKIDLEYIELSTVASLLERNDIEGLYKYMLIALCNQLHGKEECGKTTGLPEMFQKISDHTELLFPDGLRKPNSVLTRMAIDLADDDWKDIEIVGWMYQYYISEKHDEVIDINKSSIKKEDIPAATQLFTPEWIVRYMVQNSLGRLWLEGHPNQTLRDKWSYYLDEAQQELEVETQLIMIREGYADLSPEDITVLDPCMGSGHILVYAFDLLMDIYRSRGYTDRDAVACIVQKNLFGLDIDDRAAQLAYFAIMMKALEYDSRFLHRGIQPNLCAIQESNSIAAFDRLSGQLGLDSVYINLANDLITTFHDAKIYGSILNVAMPDAGKLSVLMDKLLNASLKDINLLAWYEDAVRLLPQLVRQAQIMGRKYNILVTNPPYMNQYNTELKKMIQSEYKDYGSDLFSVFIYRNFRFCKDVGYSAFMSPFVWMFIKSYEKLRDYIINQKCIVSLIQMEYSAFEDATVPLCTFILRNQSMNYTGVYIRLTDFKGGMSIQNAKYLEAQADPFCKYRYEMQQKDFLNIDGIPLAYWATPKVHYIFKNMPSLLEVAHPCIGMRTGDNERFLRYWYEVANTNFGIFSNADDAKLSGIKWFPYNKGGDFRRWYGNNTRVVNWQYDGEEIKAETRKRYPMLGDNLGWKISNESKYFSQGITWSDITSATFSGRYSPPGALFDVKGSSCFPEPSLVNYVLGFLNSNTAQAFIKMLNPTITTQVGDMARLPVFICSKHKFQIDKHVSEAIDISKSDWDSSETSWDFQRHPLVTHQIRGSDNTQLSGGKAYVETSFKHWQMETQSRFDQLKAIEEELNRIFIEIYGLQGELTPEVEEKDVTVRRADLKRDIRGLVSYAVGCMFGRYSLDVEGLAYAGSEWDESMYTTFIPDKDTILPITDDEYFDDDIVNRFASFIRIVYGAETLEENLRYIAKALGSSGNTPREVLRNFFLHEFYPDHCRVYKKRPIYWLFDSGKEDGFKALVYLHRYNRDTLARLRTDYVHELQERFRTQLVAAQKLSNTGDARQKGLASKRVDKLSRQIAEVGKYEEILHHMADQRIELDLDEGVAVNYAKMCGLVAKIK